MPRVFERRLSPLWVDMCKERNVNLRNPMSEHEREMLTILCSRIVEEKDRAVFTELLIELETLLDKAGWPKNDA